MECDVNQSGYWRREKTDIYHSVFSRYHYLDADILPTAQCYVYYIGGNPAIFIGFLPNYNSSLRISRLVILPRFTGRGLLSEVVKPFVLAKSRQVGMRVSITTSHPTVIDWCYRQGFEWRICTDGKFSFYFKK